MDNKIFKERIDKYGKEIVKREVMDAVIFCALTECRICPVYNANSCNNKTKEDKDFNYDCLIDLYKFVVNGYKKTN